MTVGGQQRYRLRVGDAGALSVGLVKAPQLSLVLLLTSRSSAPAVGQMACAARASVRRSGRFALASVIASAGQGFPDSVTTPIPPVTDVSVADQVQRLRELPGEVLVDDLTRTFGPELPPWWRAAGEQPGCWLDSCAAAMVDAWSVVSPMWRQVQPLLDREARRVGAAVVRGATDVLLNTLHPRMRYENGEFWVPAMQESSLDLRGRRLVLVPTVAGPMGRLVSFDMPDVAYIAYPVRGQADLDEHAAAARDPDGDRLDVLLGRVRADLLRAVGRPFTMGQLATAVGCAARVATYHCGRLEAAGLIVRERRGQSVWVRRTVRGHELVDLLS